VRFLAAIAVSLCLALTLSHGPVKAVEPDEKLDDPALEARAREISAGVRCLVCQNESIDSSNADLARDLRLLVRERLKAGDSDQEVRAFLVARYGDFVLLKPPVKPATYLLWFGPAVILLGGALGVLFYLRRRRSGAGPGHRPAPLSPEEQRRLESILSDDHTA
jgi:cytochrome c-type biogenesis protein CcmH